MNDEDDKQALFGTLDAANTPKAYVAALRRLLKESVAELVEVDGARKRVYWIDGRSLGWLECRGIQDADAVIDGQVIQLNDVYVELKVDVVVDRRNNTVESGRVAKIAAPQGKRVELDASPGSAPDSEERARIETFIDQVLLAIAGHSFVGATAAKE